MERIQSTMKYANSQIPLIFRSKDVIIDGIWGETEVNAVCLCARGHDQDEINGTGMAKRFNLASNTNPLAMPV